MPLVAFKPPCEPRAPRGLAEKIGIFHSIVLGLHLIDDDPVGPIQGIDEFVMYIERTLGRVGNAHHRQDQVGKNTQGQSIGYGRKRGAVEDDVIKSGR